MSAVKFWMDEQQVSTAKAAGAIPQQIEDVPLCPFAVGDTLSFAGFRPLAYRVVSRHFRSEAADGEASWLVQLEPSPHPLG